MAHLILHQQLTFAFDAQLRVAQPGKLLFHLFVLFSFLVDRDHILVNVKAGTANGMQIIITAGGEKFFSLRLGERL